MNGYNKPLLRVRCWFDSSRRGQGENMRFNIIFALFVGLAIPTLSNATDLSNCDESLNSLYASYSKVNVSITTTDNNIKEYRWLTEETKKTIKTGITNESDNVGKLFYIAKEYKNRGEFIRCSAVSTKGVSIANSLQSLLTEIPKSIKESKQKQSSLKNESKCKSETECNKIYDYYSQYVVSLAFKKYQDEISPIYKEINLITEK